MLGIDNLQGYGNDLVNNLTGNSGNNLLDGGVGVDSMAGAFGDDFYIVDNAGDTIVENPGEGNDAVSASVNFTLADNIETLILTGNADLQGSGNGLSNLIQGNVGNNLINGLGGADGMVGGAGNDTYFADNAGDAVVENANEGLDTVLAMANHRLTANVEALTLLGGDNLQGYGNDLVNNLIGNSGNNLLDGGIGGDSMTGALGDDFYIVDNAGDTIVENPGEGNDAISASVDVLALADNVETLILTGSAIVGFGNNLANQMLGNADANALDGIAGNDVLEGGANGDSLTGGSDDDIFVFRPHDANGDTVVDFTGALAGGNDKLLFAGYQNFNFVQEGLDAWRIEYDLGGGPEQDHLVFQNAPTFDPVNDFIFQ